MATAASFGSSILLRRRLLLSNAEALSSPCAGRTSQTCGMQWPILKTQLPTLAAGLRSSRPWRKGEADIQTSVSHICRAQGPDEGKSCCGGSGESGSNGNGRCSSHGASEPVVDTSGIGKEFEALVSKKTMEEFEALYDSGQMDGNIPRSIMADVATMKLEGKGTSNAEKFLDVEELLAEATSLAAVNGGGLIFDEDFDEDDD